MHKCLPDPDDGRDLTYTEFAKTVALPETVEWKIKEEKLPTPLGSVGAHLTANLYDTSLTHMSPQNISDGARARQPLGDSYIGCVRGLMRFMRARGVLVGERGYTIDGYLKLQGLSEWKQALYNIGLIVVGYYYDDEESSTVALLYGYSPDYFYGLVGGEKEEFKKQYLWGKVHSAWVPLLFNDDKVLRTIQIKRMKAQLGLIDSASRPII